MESTSQLPVVQRRFQFRLRTLFVIVALASFPLAWIGYQFERKRQAKAWTQAAYDQTAAQIKAAIDDGSIHLIAPEHPSMWCIVNDKYARDYAEYCGREGAMQDFLPPFAGSSQYAEETLLKLGAVFTRLKPTKVSAVHFTAKAVTDNDVQYLTARRIGRELKSLDLSGQTGVTDAGVKYLRHLVTLQNLNLQGTGVSDEGIERLQKALPECRIEH
jgi:hypothetical protein